jgi:hypothetical protein
MAFLFDARRMGCEQQILPGVQNPLLFMACSLVMILIILLDAATPCAYLQGQQQQSG